MRKKSRRAAYSEKKIEACCVRTEVSSAPATTLLHRRGTMATKGPKSPQQGTHQRTTTSSEPTRLRSLPRLPKKTKDDNSLDSPKSSVSAKSKSQGNPPAIDGEGISKGTTKRVAVSSHRATPLLSAGPMESAMTRRRGKSERSTHLCMYTCVCDYVIVYVFIYIDIYRYI